MRLSRFAVASLLSLGLSSAYGQAFPTKPIRIITSEPGGAGDYVSRMLSQGLAASLGKPVLVENVTSVLVAGGTLAKSPPDGYVLITYGGTLWLAPFLSDAPYDPAKDLAAVTLVGQSPCIFVVNPALPVNSVADVVAMAKAKPGALNYGSGNSGAITHLAVELFKSMAGVDVVRIPYKGAGPAINDLVAGRVQLMIATATSVSPLIKSGKLKALAVTSAQPSELLPGMPTVTSTGVPGYEAQSFTGIFARAGTPAPVINRLNQEIVKLIKQPEVTDKLANLGVEMVASPPERLAAVVKSEMASMGKVIKDAGIKGE